MRRDIRGPYVRRSAVILPLGAALLGLFSCRSDAPVEPSTPLFTTAVTRVVNSVADPGTGGCTASQCTLREAINAAGTTAITFAAGLTGPITLAKPVNGGGELLIGSSLTITGPSGGIVIQRASSSPSHRIVHIGAGASVTLTNLSLRNGKIASGGGILNEGTLSLSNSTVSGNSATQGGGIYNKGPLTLTNSTVSGNSASTTSGPAGGIDNHGGFTLVHSTITGNTGCGIFNHNNFILTLTTTTVGQNTGCGIANDGGTLKLTSSSVTGNSSVGISANRGSNTLTQSRVISNHGGGISLGHGPMTLTRSIVSGNSSPGDGGGVANFAGTLTILSSTIMNNSAVGLGGGIFNTVSDPFGRLSSTLTLTNSTVSGNSAGSGGGIDNSDRLGGAGAIITNSTIAFNSAQSGGGGIRQAEGFDDPNGVSLRNSLVAKNTAPAAPDVQGTSFFASFTLIGDGTGSNITNGGGNKVGKVSPNVSAIDPKLGALALNGGPTRTHALLLGSPAIDAASSTNCPAKDQRGVTRPQGAACDMGSYERQ
jgi:CSLREA domain-containing protein